MEVFPNQQRFLNKVFLRSLEVFITIFFFTGGVVSYWRGIWAWQDNFLFPEDYALSIWASGVIGILTLIISFPMRWFLNRMVKFNEKFDYCPIPRLQKRKKNDKKKSILQDVEQAREFELEELVIQSSAFGDFATTPGNPNSNIVLVSKKRLPRIKSISAKKFATKTRLANEKAQSKRDSKKTQEKQMDAPKLVVSNSKSSNLMSLSKEETTSKNHQSTDSERDEQQTPEANTDQSFNENDAEDEKTTDSSHITKNSRTPREHNISDEANSDIHGPKKNPDVVESQQTIEIEELEDVDKFKVRIHESLTELGFLSLSFVLNLPPLVLILCVNFFVFVSRITLYVSLKVYFMYLGFIAVTVWRYFWGLWDVYTEDFYFVEMLYGSMIAGILLLLPFDALNLLASPPCLPSMYETRDSAGKVLSMNWKGFTKGILPELQIKGQQ